jgi:hypothetical protein
MPKPITMCSACKPVVDERLLLAGLCRAHRERHRQAAADQHDGVQAAQLDVELGAALGPCRRIPDPVQHVGRQEAAEEHDLLDDEDPHAKRGCFLLLLQRLEVMLEVGIVRDVPVAVAMGLGMRDECVRQP